jgi:hypothetical protein
LRGDRGDSDLAHGSTKAGSGILMGDLRGHRIFLNEDGPDSYAKGINDGRPYYTEPSFDQAVEMGKIVKEKNLFGYIYKVRKFRKTQDLRKADFMAVRGLAKGISEGS